MFRKAMIMLAMFAVLPVFQSCLDEPVKPIKESPDEPAWPDLTSEDDIVRTLVLCYDNPSFDDVMTRYENLLHSEYFFRLSPEDVEPGDPLIITRAEDIAISEAIFERQTMLELDIAATGAWYDQDEIDGAACTGCRSTMRLYFIRAQFGRDATVYQCSPGGAFVTIVIAPDESDSSKWVIRAIYDLEN